LARGRRQKLKRDDYGALRIMVDDFLLHRYLLGTSGRVSASVIYHEFVGWWGGDENGPPPSQTMVGKLLSRKLYKYKSEGCVFYRGLTHKDTAAPAIQAKAGGDTKDDPGC
jgi:hypothetical protein